MPLLLGLKHRTPLVRATGSTGAMFGGSQSVAPTPELDVLPEIRGCEFGGIV
jgi:hypothetical protein